MRNFVWLLSFNLKFPETCFTAKLHFAFKIKCSAKKTSRVHQHFAGEEKKLRHYPPHESKKTERRYAMELLFHLALPVNEEGTY